MGSRLTLLSTTHRVAPGLLTRAAWQALDDATTIAGRPEHALVPVLSDHGLTVETHVVDEVTGLSGGLASGLASGLLDQTRDTAVVWLMADDGDAALVQALAPELARRADRGEVVELEVLNGSYDLPGARLLDVVAVMDRLRSPGGCPWDAEQTHASLAPYLVEETFEALAAIDGEDSDALREELGDVLLQVAFHARIAEEATSRPWSIDDVAAELVDKLVRRHPHVFADGAAETAADVETAWHALKQGEKPRRSVIDGVPMALPALALSEKLLSRTAKAGLDIGVDEPELPEQLDEELLGAILFGVVSAARRRGLDAESALRRRAHAFAEQARRAGMPHTDG